MSETKTKTLNVGKYLKWLPTNARISKTYTGIGGSTAEITAKRNSIILMPSLKAVVQKSNTYSPLYNIDNIYGIYGGHNEIEGLKSFLNSDVKYKKIIMTMSRKSISVLLEAVKEIPSLFNFNLLLDEVDQIQDDGSWREDLSLCYDLVSIWRYEMSKVIATGVELHSNINIGSVTVISATGVEQIAFEPIKKLPLWKVALQANRNNFEVNIIETTEIEATAASIISDITEDKVFIFYNNVDGSKRIINSINKRGCRIYCGEGSENKAKELYSTDLEVFDNYNFCTKAYFRAVDFNVNSEVVILSDIKSLHAGLSVEDLVQSFGRIRKQIKKVTIIMNTKENNSKLKEMSREKITGFFRDIANQQLGAIKTLETVGELTPSFYENNESVRRDIKGEFQINWAWVEGKVKNVLEDRIAYENTTNMIKALSKYDIKASLITQPDITCSVIKEELDWSNLVNHVIRIHSAPNSAYNIFLMNNLSDNENLILEGISKLGYDDVIKTSSKYKLKEKINKFDTKGRLESVIRVVGRRFKTNSFIVSSEAKKTLQEIYKTLGYDAKAKATDLRNYFIDYEEKVIRIDGKNTKVIVVNKLK